MIKRIVTNFTALAAGEIIARICHFVSVIYIARILGAAGFGSITFSLAILSYFLMFTNLGLGELGVREVARRRDPKEIAETILSIRCAIAALSCAVIFILAFLVGKSRLTTCLIIAYSVTLFPYALSLEWVFRGIEKMKYNAYGRIMNAAIYVGLIFAFVRSSSDIMNIAFITLGADLVTCAFYYLTYVRKFGPPRLHIDLKRWRSLVSVSAQLFLSSAFVIMYLNFGTVALGFMKSEESVGIYGAAYKLVFFFYALSDVIVAATFPVASRLFHESRDKLEGFVTYCVKGTLLIGLPIAVGGCILGPKIVEFVYGASYERSVPLLRIMSWFVAANLTSYVLSYSLVACDRQRDYLKVVGYATLFNVLFNVCLTPFIGYYAPSIAIVLTECAILVLSGIAMRSVARIPFIKLAIKPFAASVLMGIVLMALFRVNIFLVIIAGALTYLAAITFLGGVTKAEIVKLREAFA